MNQPEWPTIPVPVELSDEAAAHLLDFLYDLAAAIESAYAGQLHRYYQGEREQQEFRLLDDDSNPPF